MGHEAHDGSGRVGVELLSSSNWITVRMRRGDVGVIYAGILSESTGKSAFTFAGGARFYTVFLAPNVIWTEVKNDGAISFGKNDVHTQSDVRLLAK
jgi:hypothetical protein